MNNDLLENHKRLRQQAKEAWERIPKNCPFYEMAPELYDSFECASEEFKRNAVKIVDEYLGLEPTWK